jgi:ATPase subunit of ABC transporter with duplicated ATPase domains
MNKLTKLTINKFRNVKPTTLEFRPGINVVLGKNAAGKTTLLRLLATVMGADDDALQDDVLDVSCHASGAELDFEHTLIKAPQSMCNASSRGPQIDDFLMKFRSPRRRCCLASELFTTKRSPRRFPRRRCGSPSAHSMSPSRSCGLVPRWSRLSSTER